MKLKSKLVTAIVFFMPIILLVILYVKSFKPITPQISFEHINHDADVITDFDKSTVRHIFKFTNTGRQQLDIFDLKTNCSCTVPELTSIKTKYAPGQSGEIEVSVYASNPGPIIGQVLILSNAPTSPDALSLNFDFLPKTVVNFMPRIIEMTDYVPGISKPEELLVNVITRDLMDISIDNIESYSGFVSAKLTGKSRSNKKSDRGYYNHILKISVSAKVIHSGPFSDKLKISFSDNTISSLEISVKGNITSQVDCKPSKVFLVWDNSSDMVPERSITVYDKLKETFDLKVENPLEDILKIDVDDSNAIQGLYEISISCRKIPEGYRVNDLIKLNILKEDNTEIIDLPVTILKP